MKVICLVFTLLTFMFTNLHAVNEGSDLHFCEAMDTSKAPQDVSSLLEPIIARHHIPGIAAVVIHNGRILAAGAAGVRAHSSPERITLNDLFHIGSDTKAMTATLAAILVEKGLLNWNSKVIDLFPELSNKINPAYRSLTLEQLLTHRGGLPANIDFLKIQNASSNDLVKARQLAMEQILSESPATSPGTFLYSNSGYVIAGHMEEKAAGRPWEDLMKEHLFIPLKISSAGFGAPGTSQTIDQPRGHDEKGNAVVPGPAADNPAIMGPAGTVHLSIIDWAKFINLHLKAAEGNACFLKTSSFQKLQQPIENPQPPYAMGWIVENLDWAKGKVLIHAGSNQLWYAKVWIAPNRDLAILVALNSNGEEAAKAANDVGLALLKMQLQLPHLKAIDNSTK